VPIYFLEILIGLVQAFVFTLLTAVYIGLACNHPHEESHTGEHAEGHDAANAAELAAVPVTAGNPENNSHGSTNV
jgi:F-type H+-transporting ATPase subunit a